MRYAFSVIQNRKTIPVRESEGAVSSIHIFNRSDNNKRLILRGESGLNERYQSISLPYRQLIGYQASLGAARGIHIILNGTLTDRGHFVPFRHIFLQLFRTFLRSFCVTLSEIGTTSGILASIMHPFFITLSAFVPAP
jgi:hypothetical protein